MACLLFGARPLPDPVLIYCQLDPQEQTSVNIRIKMHTFFINEKAFENVVCEFATILSRKNELRINV